MVMADTESGIRTACDVQGFVEVLAANSAALTSFISDLSFSKQRYNEYSHSGALKAAYKLFVKVQFYIYNMPAKRFNRF